MRLLALLLCLLAAPAAAVELTLEGPLQQGGLLYGRTDPGATVALNDATIPVSPDGRFLIGLDRDAPAEVLVEALGSDGSRVERRLAIAPRDYRVQRIDGLPPEKVNPPEEEVARILAEKARIEAARLSPREATDWGGGFIWPVTGRITGDYGRQRILNGEPRQPHYGIDIAAPVGTPVLAPADGLVVLTEEDLFFQGKMIIIDHGQGLKSGLMHLSEILVRPGDLVTKGQVVAKVGATGRVTGAHLDWRVNWFGAWIDPAQLVPPMTH